MSEKIPNELYLFWNLGTAEQKAGWLIAIDEPPVPAYLCAFSKKDAEIIVEDQKIKWEVICSAVKVK